MKAVLVCMLIACVLMAIQTSTGSVLKGRSSSSEEVKTVESEENYGIENYLKLTVENL